LEESLPGIGQAKVCCTCKELKPLGAFNLLRSAKDGRQYSCRECNKAYHYANWDRHMAQIRRRKKRQVALNRAFVAEYLRSHPCVDCGETDIVVLEFDHLRDKLGNISAMVRASNVARIEAEIAKCEVVCANCHRRRTAQRGGWYRTQV
jgi:hypothetical protein